MQNFIKTGDQETIAYLRSLGFKEMKSDRHSSVVTFINDKTKPITFEDAKFIYTDKLEI